MADVSAPTLGRIEAHTIVRIIKILTSGFIGGGDIISIASVIYSKDII
jgi:hypothetical protein